MNSDPNSIPLWSQQAEAALISSVLNGGPAALDAFLAGPASGKSVKAVATESEAAE